MEFVILKIQVTNEDGDPVKLDDFHTESDHFDEVISIQEEEFSEPEEGKYPLLTDGQMEKLSFEGFPVTFVGKIDDKVVVAHEVIVAKDCCHVQLKEGDLSVSVDLD